MTPQKRGGGGLRSVEWQSVKYSVHLSIDQIEKHSERLCVATDTEDITLGVPLRKPLQAGDDSSSVFGSICPVKHKSNPQQAVPVNQTVWPHRRFLQQVSLNSPGKCKSVDMRPIKLQPLKPDYWRPV